MKDYLFNRIDRLDWLEDICLLRQQVELYSDGLMLVFGQFPVSELTAEHIAPLACLIEEFANKGISVHLNRDSDVGEALWSKYRLRQYWGGGQNYAESEDDRILNLQRMIAEGKDMYGRRVSDFLKNKYFHQKDMTPVNSSLTEAFYNVFDHADAKGNAFSMVLYDEEKQNLHVAICDFGKGIAKTVKEYLHSEEMSDGDAIKKAMEDRFTIGSFSYNGGLGLGVIRASCTDEDTLWLVSNHAALAANANGERVIPLSFEFGGTLVFYSMALSHFEDEETIEDFIF